MTNSATSVVALCALLLASSRAEALDRWADSVIGFSSESEIGAADTALGDPDVRDYGNSPKAWSPATSGAGVEYLAVGFKRPVLATGVRVVESNQGGFVTRIDLLDTKGVWHENVWKGKDGTSNAAPVGMLEASFERTAYLVKGVKIHTKIAGSEQIDAVQLRGGFNHLSTYFGERFRKAGYKFGQNSLAANVVKIVSGPKSVTMRRKKIKPDRSPVCGPDGKQLPVTGKQWVVESAGFRFKVTIDDDVLEDKNPKHRGSIESIIKRIKHVPPPYMRAFEKVSDPEKPGPDGWEEDGVAVYYTIGGAGGHGGWKYLNLINDGGLGVLVHEGGHVLESSMTNEEDKTIPKQWQAAIAADAPWSVSGYGDSVWHEDCAEFSQLHATCMDIELGPAPPTFDGRKPIEELKRLSPARFKLWETILCPPQGGPRSSK